MSVEEASQPMGEGLGLASACPEGIGSSQCNAAAPLMHLCTHTTTRVR